VPFDLEINSNVIEMEYAVRGPIPKRAAVLRAEGRTTIPCNIGNPQALGQRPLTFFRQVLSLVEDPDRIQRERLLGRIIEGGELANLQPISDYELDLAERILSEIQTGMGAYTDSNGPAFIRKAVADYIDDRDRPDAPDFVPSDPDRVYLTNGASEAARYLIEMLIAGPRDGIMIPIPQYPLYSATIRRCGGVQVDYHPDEDAGWVMDRSILEDAYERAGRDGVNVKAIVVINPGNPTGAILDEGNVREVIDFAEEHDLAVLADEVYQDNLYGADWVSFARVLGSRRVPLFSMHSVSKGFYGECGHRGGYVEVRNPPRVTGTDVPFTDLLFKQASVSLCSNTAGQVLICLMVSPPREGSEPHERFVREKEGVLRDLYDKATMIRAAFTEMEGVQCFGRTGAMYLFPRLEKLPAGTGDYDYCMNLLEETGLTTVNGSGFGQREGTHHLRIAFLPPREMLEEVLPRWITFHNAYVNR